VQVAKRIRPVDATRDRGHVRRRHQGRRRGSEDGDRRRPQAASDGQRTDDRDRDRNDPDARDQGAVGEADHPEQARQACSRDDEHARDDRCHQTGADRQGPRPSLPQPVDDEDRQHPGERRGRPDARQDDASRYQRRPAQRPDRERDECDRDARAGRT
jgi:hypothetical protein